MAESIGEGRGCCLVQAEGKFNATFLIFASTQYHTALVDNAVLRDPPSLPARRLPRQPDQSARAARTPACAARFTRACRINPRIEKRLRPGTALWHHVVDYLKAGYSPEQVAGTLATVHPDVPPLQVSHETIYTAIYAMPRGALRTEVISCLRLGHAKRRPRARGADRRGKIPDMVRIQDRPPEVAERVVL